MGLSEKEELELLELENENAHASTAPEPKTTAGRVLNTVNQLRPPVTYGEISKSPFFSGSGTSGVPNPFASGPVGLVEKAGTSVKDAVRGVANRIAESQTQFPVARAALATGLHVATDMAPFTPSEFALNAGAELLPTAALSPLSARTQRLAKTVGDNFVNTPIKSLQKSVRTGSDTLGTRFLKETKLPGNENEAFSRAHEVVNDYEKLIQAKLEQSASGAKIQVPSTPNGPDIPGDSEFSQLSSKLQEPVVLPSGGKIERFAEPKVGTIPSYVPEELNLMTQGSKFTAGESKGLFNPGEPDINAKQIDLINQQRAADIAKAREAFNQRTVAEEAQRTATAKTPEYSGLKKGSAISSEDIAKGFDSEIEQLGKTGTNKAKIEQLQALKQEFIDSHPKFADVQYWNEVKRAIYKGLGDTAYYKESPGFKIKAEQGVASNIRKAIEDIVPGIKDLNSRQGLYLEIADALGKKMSRYAKDVPGALKSGLKDEALVQASRSTLLNKNPLYKTRGLGAVPTPTIKALDEYKKRKSQ